MKNSVAVNLLSQMFLAQFSEEEHEALGMAIDALNELSTHRTRGKWVYHENDMLCVRWNKWECDQCHERVEYKYNFCPNCGADMRGEEE